MATIYLNGRFVPAETATVPLGERGLLFGDGVYEVYRTYHGRPFRAKEHLERLRRSAAAVRLQLPEVDWTALHAELVEENGLESADATVYIQVTRGAPATRKHGFPPAGTPPTFFVLARRLQPLDPALRERGVSVITRPDVRWGRCDIKSVNLLPNVLANQEAQEAGAWEAVFVRAGTVTEGTHTNVFAVVRGRLRTHPEGPGILGGITRNAVLEAAGAAGVPVDEQGITPAELETASEVFLTGTTAEVLPVVGVDGRPVGSGTPGPVAGRLLEGFRTLTR